MPEYVVESKPAIIDQDGRMVARIAGTGFVLGILVWALSYVLEQYILKAIFCSGGNEGVCANLAVFAGNISAVIIAVIGVVALVRFRVFRPLLIALAAMISLWGLGGWLQGLGVLEMVGWTLLLYTVAYVLYAWLARVRNVVVMLILFALVVAATRVVPMFVG